MRFSPAIATMSLGQPGLHPLLHKLEMARAHGFRGVELFWEDLLDYAAKEVAPSSSSSSGDCEVANNNNNNYHCAPAATYDGADKGHCKAGDGAHDRDAMPSPPATPPEASPAASVVDLRRTAAATPPSSNRNSRNMAATSAATTTTTTTAAAATSPPPPTPPPPPPPSAATLLLAATQVRQQCARLGMRVLSLQPFRNYDGDADPARHRARLAELRTWLSVCAALRCRVLGIPSAILGDADGFVADRQLVVRQLREAADLASLVEVEVDEVDEEVGVGAEQQHAHGGEGKRCGDASCGCGDEEAGVVGLLSRPPPPPPPDHLAGRGGRGIIIGYENLCFGSHVTRWEDAWAVVQEVDRPNLMFIPDTFNIAAGSGWVDVLSAEQQRYPHPPAAAAAGSASLSLSSAAAAARDVAWRESVARFRAAVDPAKVLYIQVADGERLSRPLDGTHPWHVDGQRPLMTWSRNARCFPFEDRGYLPLLDVMRALTDPVAEGEEAVVEGEEQRGKGLGFDGWWSFEIFSKHGADPNPETPGKRAALAEESLRRLVDALESGKEGSCLGI